MKVQRKEKIILSRKFLLRNRVKNATNHFLLKELFIVMESKVFQKRKKDFVVSFVLVLG